MVSRYRYNPSLEEDAVILGVGVVIVIVASNLLSGGAVNRAIAKAGYDVAASGARTYTNPSVQLPGLPSLSPGQIGAGFVGGGIPIAIPIIEANLAAQQAPSVWQWISNIPTSIRDWALGQSGTTPTQQTGLERGIRESGYTDSSGQRWKSGYQ